MKKTLKQIVALVIAFTMISCLFTGCGEKTKDDTVVIHWYMKKPVSDMSRQSEVEEEANKIIYEKLGIKLQFHFIETAAWKNKVNVMMSSGSDYDIISTSGSEFINNAQKGAFADIKDSVENYGTTIKEKLSDFSWDATTFGEAVYGVPAQTFYVPYSAFAYRKDLVEKYDFDYTDATSYNDIEPFLKQIKDNELGIDGIVATTTGGVSMPRDTSYSLTNLDFLYYDHNAGEFKVKFFVDSIKDNNEKFTEFAKKGYISSSAISKNEPVSEMKSGKYAVINGRRSAEKSTNLYGFECVESKPTYGVISTMNVLNSVNAISSKSEHIDECIKLLNLIWEDSYLSNTLAYGIENKDYTVDKGDVHNYEDINEIHITTNSGTNVKWSIWHNWLGPLWDQWDSPWNTRESLKEMQSINNSAEVSPVLGFMINTENIKTEVAQISSICKDADQVFLTGSAGDFNKYMSDLESKLKKAGIDKVIKEVNSQYKEWKKQIK